MHGPQDTANRPIAKSWLALGLGLAVFDILVTFFDILETGVPLG